MRLHWYVEHEEGSGLQIFLAKSKVLNFFSFSDQRQFQFLGSAAAQEDTSDHIAGYISNEELKLIQYKMHNV